MPLSRRYYILAGMLAALAVLALAIDVPLAAWFYTPNQPREFKLFSLAEVFAHGLGVACILLTVYVLDHANRRRVLRLAVCAFGSGLLSNVIKLSVGRYRPRAIDWSNIHGVWETYVSWLPCVTQGWVQFKNNDIQSLPSSHTATATGLALALTWLYPQGRWLFAGFVVLASLQRLQAGAHFASDTLAGAAIGCLFAGWCLAPRGLDRWFARFESRE